MKQSVKTITSLALAGCLWLGAALPATAAEPSVEPTAKEEVVYVNLSHDGRVDTIYVVNSFEPMGASGSTIIDYGTYSSVKNLTTTDEIKIAGNKITVPAPNEKFYYQGTLERRDIPWDISIAYWLDGKPITGENLAGKSGHLEISLKARQSSTTDEVYVDNYALQANLSLDSEKCKNIDAPNATLANVGDKKQMTYIIMPGKNKDITITADVVDFEMDGFQINAIPMNIDIDDPDTTEIKDRIYELIDGAEELDDGAMDLDDGATRLDDGVTTLHDGVGDLREGVDDLIEGADDLHQGTSDLLGGVLKLSKGATELRDGTQSLASGASQFQQGMSTLDSQSATLVSGSTQINEALGQMQLGLSSFDQQAIDQITQQAGALQAGSQSYLDTLDSMIASYEQQLDAALGLGSSSTSEEIAVLDSSITLLKNLKNNYAPINGGVQSLTQGITSTLPKMVQIIFAVETLSQNFSTMNDGILAYTQGVGQLTSSFTSLSGGIDKLSDGTEDLKEGTGDLSSGADELHEGTFDLTDGVTKLDDGTTQLSDGVTELKDGTVELKDGTIDLVDGTHELREETADLDDEVDERIDEILDDYRGKDFDMISYVSPSENTNITALQFVMKSPEIKKPEEKKEPVQPRIEEQEEKETPWDRFLKLFD